MVDFVLTRDLLPIFLLLRNQHFLADATAHELAPAPHLLKEQQHSLILVLKMLDMDLHFIDDDCGVR